LILFTISLSNTFFVLNSGVLYYLGDSTPTSLEMDIINDWKKLPVILLIYDGPYEYKGIVEDILKRRGYLLGYGKEFVVKIRVHRNVFVYQMIYGDIENDNFLSPAPLEKANKILEKAISEILPKFELPKKLFTVYYDPESGKFMKKIEGTEKILEEGDTPSPVMLRVLSKKYYRVKIGNTEEKLKEGFHVISGKLVYVGKNLKLENLLNFFPNVERVFPRKNDLIFYQKGFLIFPDGNVLKVEKPIDVVGDVIILPTGILQEGKLREVEETILWVENDIILTSQGELKDLNMTWSFKVSSVPREWCFRGNFFYVLDMCGFLRKYDLKRRKLIWEKKIEGAWGLDVSDESVMVGVKGGILVLNNQNGNAIKKIDGEDFSYWENVGFLIYKDETINGEYVGEGYFLRYEGVPVFIRKDGSVVVFGDRKYELQRVKEVIGFSWGIEVVTEEGTWLIGRK